MLSASLPEMNEEQRFEPFYLARDGDSRSGAYYTVNRVPRVLTAKEKKFGAVSSYAGSEVFISLVDAQAAPYKRQLSQLNVTALCTNRHLPIQLPISVGDTRPRDGTLLAGCLYPLGRRSNCPDCFHGRR